MSEREPVNVDALAQAILQDGGLQQELQALLRVALRRALTALQSDDVPLRIVQADLLLLEARVQALEEEQ